MSDAIIIGIDHGYAAMKSKNFSFPTGLVEYEHGPYTRKDVLELGGRFYVVGTGRQPLQKDKTQTEDYYLLTLAAIAKELEHRQAGPAATVHLAAGLPLTSFGRDKKKFKEYLFRDGQPVTFRYEWTAYTVTIERVSLFPQGYAAVLTQNNLLDEPSVIVADIGGWTVDLMRLDGRIPNASTCRSLELGMIRCLDEISEHVRRTLGLSLTAAQIESVLCGEPSSVDNNAKTIIHREAGAYTRRLLSAIPVGQRIDTLCLAVCREHDRDNLVDAVRAVIREELGGVSFIKEENEQPQQAGDVGNDVLGYLLSLDAD